MCMGYAEVHLNRFHDKHSLDIWKSKSLNSMPTETYSINYDRSRAETRPMKDTAMGKNQGASELPEPKVSKINEAVFCIYLHNQLNVYKYMTREERQFQKINLTFFQTRRELPSDINFVTGNGSQYIFVGIDNTVIVFGLKWKQKDNDYGKQLRVMTDIVQVQRIDIHEVKQISFTKEYQNDESNNYLVAVSRDTFYKFAIKENFHLVKKTKIGFDNGNEQIYSNSKPIHLLTENENTLYLFSVVQQSRPFITDVSERDGTSNNKLCEVLYLTKFVMGGAEIGDFVSGQVSPIDHVFETDIFNKSKVYLLGESAFLLSLHEEIVVIQEHFGKYIALNNISLVASKSSDKKGQLILANKIVMVYTESGEIFAQNIYYSSSEGLKTPRIDNFKGNENDEQILYDAIVLEYQPGSFMKVLIYFTKSEVFVPNESPHFNAQNKEQDRSKDKNELQLTILCIQQDSPVNKLGQLFRNKKPPNEINEFVQRFNIDQLTRSKCEWSVSEKTEKDIENLLLQIKDNEFIQEQLTKILKSCPHDIKFLNMIETKQIARYKKMLVTKLLKFDDSVQKSEPSLNSSNSLLESGDSLDSGYSPRETDYLKDIIRWLMESIMFKKKLTYSKNFLEFKEYDFIEIGKLKAASLKEQIKLLSCKGFEKRLQYFLNNFKYMALYDFEEIFCFLINDKNEEEVRDFFIKNYPFVLPNFEEDSEIFKNKGRAKKVGDALRMIEQIAMEHNDCELWVYNFNRHDIESKSGEEREQIEMELAKIETVTSFSDDIIKEIELEKKKQGELAIDSKYKEAIYGFTSILNSFIREEWFINNISKQHSILSQTIDQLEHKFLYLKRIGVFHILIKLFYEKIAEGEYDEEKIDKVLQDYKQHGLIPESFYANIAARKKIYDLIRSEMGVRKPPRSEFLIMEETNYFWFLFNHHRGMLLKEVKVVYDSREPGFFREKFKIFLTSKGMVLEKIIDFLDEFEGNSNDEIRMDVFTCIKELLMIKDKENTKVLVNKLMDMEILKDEDNTEAIDELIDEAKVVFGYYFFNFFSIFELDYSYKDLVDNTLVREFENNSFILTIMEQYVTKSSELDEQSSFHENQDDLPEEDNQLVVKFEEIYDFNEIKPINLKGEPMQFFSLLLYMIDTLRFRVESATIFDELVRLYLNQNNFEGLAVFIEKMHMDGREIEEANNTYRNYILLREFLENHSCDQRLTNCLIRWIRETYIFLLDHDSRYKEFIHNFGMISDALEALDKLMVKSIISKQISFLQMLKNIDKLQPSLLVYVLNQRYEHFTKEELSLMKLRSQYALRPDELEENSKLLTSLSGFLFMTHIIINIDKIKFAITDKELIINQLTLMERIYQNFIDSSSYDNSQTGESENAGYIRFNNQLALKLIRFKNFEYSFQAVLKSVNTQCYFRDVIFQFMASIRVCRADHPKLKHLVTDFIRTDSKVRVINLLQSFVEENQICEFETNRNDAKQNAEIVLMEILSTRRLDDAFFFLTRNNDLSITHATSLGFQREQELFSYGTIAAYLKCLREHISVEFYPTFEFFKQKHATLVNEFERLDIIKDINIAIIKMRQSIVKNEKQILNIEKQLIGEIIIPPEIKSEIRSKSDTQSSIEKKERRQRGSMRTQLQNYKPCLIAKTTVIKADLEELEELYTRFMDSHGMDAEIKLQKSIKPEKLQANSRIIAGEELQQGRKLFRGKSDDLDNQSVLLRPQIPNAQVEQKIKKLKQNSRYIDLAQKVDANVLDSKQMQEKYQRIIEEKRNRQPSPRNILSEYEQLKKREQEEIESVKSSYKSQASERVNKLIEEMRNKRNQIIHNSLKPTDKAIRQEQKLPFRHPEAQISKQTNAQQSRQPEAQQGIEEKYHKSAKQYLSQIQKRKQGLEKLALGGISSPQMSIEEMIRLFAQREPQCRKYVEKLEFVRNNVELCLQILRNVYQSIYSFDLFIRFLNFLLDYNPQYRAIIEEKACKIATQALGIEYKIDLKQLFPLELFTTVVNVPSGEYYRRAYEMVRPNLVKIMRKPDINVHGLAILFRYGFGSQNTYYYRVYEDFLSTLIKQYNDNNFDSKELFMLAEKLRALSSNIAAESREIKFESLIREIKNEDKRRQLAREILKIIERRQDMLSGDRSSDIKGLLEKFV